MLMVAFLSVSRYKGPKWIENLWNSSIIRATTSQAVSLCVSRVLLMVGVYFFELVISV